MGVQYIYNLTVFPLTPPMPTASSNRRHESGNFELCTNYAFVHAFSIRLSLHPRPTSVVDPGLSTLWHAMHQRKFELYNANYH